MKRRRLVSTGFGVALGLALSAPAPAKAGPTAFTIDQFMQAPYPTSLEAAPVGTAAAWVFDARGARNIWIGDAAHGISARQVTNFTGDDGNDVGEVAWSPDARAIAFTRGQTLEDDAPANVASAPEGPSFREIWVVPTEGGNPRKLSIGHSPVFSPDGSRFVFLDNHRIMTVDPRGTEAPHALLTDFGEVRSITWSPDGHRLAFVSQRHAHAFVGLYDVAARTITWIAPSFDNDSSPVFSPDSSQVAFVRTLTQSTQPLVRRRAGLPWSIWVADAATGAGHRVWSADPGPGSVYRPTLWDRNLLWTADGQLVFPWEKTGWLLPYAVSSTGGTARPVAAGAFEMAYMTLSPDRRRIVFASNQGDIDRLHIWTSNAAEIGAGGSATPVAGLASIGRDGIEAFPAIAADGTIFALRSGATRELAPVVLQGDRWQPLAPAAMPASFPSDQMVAPRSVTFRANDGLLTHGQLFEPGGTAGANARRPAILFFHGGPSRQMLAGFHYMSAYAYMYGLNQYFASQGYLVLSVNYRGGIGYGLDYREAKDFGAAGGSEANDLLGAVTYLQERPDVDPKRIGIWGGSYGGLMTALGLARASGSLAVGVDYAGVYDWPSMLAVEGAPIEDMAARQTARLSSPVAAIDRWRSPVLVVQADDDRNVPASQSTELIQDLRAHGVPFEQMILPNEVHDLTRHQSWVALFEATDRYLNRYLHPDTGK